MVKHDGCRLTVEVLPIKLLNELQHHSIERALPEEVPRRETFQPSRLSFLVLGSNTEHQLLDHLLDEWVIQGYAVQFRNDRPRFLGAVRAQQVTTMAQSADRDI